MDTAWWESLKQGDRLLVQRRYLEAQTCYRQSIAQNPGECGTTGHIDYCQAQLKLIAQRLTDSAGGR